jgi:peptidoglycan/xylan/chitin deacetylase (PgdA/CDA1 family)
LNLPQRIDRIIKLLISAVFFIADCFLDSFFKALGIKRQKSCTILVYHSVFSDERLSFAQQMDTLLKIGTPIDVSRLGKEYTQNRPVLVTFDDGFRSFRENALPEMVKRKIPVVVFVPSRCLGERPGFTAHYKTRVMEMVMTSEELLSLPPELVTIGSHARTHAHLPLIDQDTAEQEIFESRNDLEVILNRAITLFAFPYGEYNDQILEWSRQAGYQQVFSLLPHRTEKNYFLWGRIDTSPHDLLVEFKLKVKGAYGWLPWAVVLKRKLKKFSRKSEKRIYS